MSTALLAAFADALRQEPEPLGAEARAALARAAIERVDDEALVDSFADALRQDEPAVDDGALVERALRPPVIRSERPAPPSRSERELRSQYRFWVGSAVAASALLFVAAGLWAQALFSADRPVASVPQTVLHQLAGGHRITAMGDAQLQIAERASRVRVTLDSGEALFDVAPGSDFEVVAAGLSVTVTGTVFTVERAGPHVYVRVYEGSVRVASEAQAEVLVAGDHYPPSGSPDGRLDELAREAARSRHRLASASEGHEARGHPRRAVEPEPETDPVSPALVPEAPGSDLPARSRAEGDRSAVSAVRRALASRRYERALTLLEPVMRRRSTPERQMLRGDALRGLGHSVDALAAYRSAMRGANRQQRAVAGLAGARLLAGPLSQPDVAHQLLADSGALEAWSSVVPAARRLDASLESR